MNDEASLRDEQRIRDVIVRYFAGLDRKDPALFKQVFIEDAVMTALGGQLTFTGRAEIVQSLMTVRNYEHTSHYPTSQLIDVDGDAAKADTFGIAFIALAEPEPKMMIRGLQYLDELVRTEAGWRIRRREHIPTWQFETDRLAPQLPGAAPLS